MSVRVRYAPSPTGLQHIGGVRTALFNYLFARSSGGRFILRIEDTDCARSEQRYLQDLYDSLEWLGIRADEGPTGCAQKGGPYVQSQRLELYQKYAKDLLDQGKAYYCFCSAERLAQLRREQEKSRASLQGYDRRCRSLHPAEAAARRAAGESCALRFAIPLEGATVFHDLLLGDIKRVNRDINPDPVILKTDGYPTYHLANVVDDHLMQITHVLRAQEWLSSGPLHILLYRAFGWPPPQFCHLPMVMGQDGAKLSKRHGATSLIDFRKKGYLPEAIINYLALLGWAFDDSREFFTLVELEQCFDLNKLSRSPATFDYQKLEWFNGQYIRQLDISRLQELLRGSWQEQLPEVYQPLPPDFDRNLKWILPLLRERLKFLNEAPTLAAYFFSRPEYSQPTLALPPKHNIEQTLKLLRQSRAILTQLDAGDWQNLIDAGDWQNFDALLAVKKVWEEFFRSAAKNAGGKMGALMQPLRYAITGRKASPPLLESMIILRRMAGTAELLARIDQVARLLAEQVDP